MLPFGEDFFSLYYTSVDWMLTNDQISEVVQLTYQSTTDKCSNCIYNNGQPTNLYNGSGPYPFSFGLCPLCNGKGYKDVEAATENIRLRVYWESRDWRKIVSKIEYPNAKCMILGAIDNLPKITKANKIQIFTNSANYNEWTFKLAGEPFLHGFGSRYFGAFLERL
jgi:hypothetical protein